MRFQPPTVTPLAGFLGEQIRDYERHEIRLRGLIVESPEGDFAPLRDAVSTAEQNEVDVLSILLRVKWCIPSQSMPRKPFLKDKQCRS